MWDHLPPDVVCHAVAHLPTTTDRHSARSTCRSWRASLDAHWRHGAFLARQPGNPTDKAGLLLPRFRALQPLLWAQLRSLDLAELNAQRAATLLPQLTPAHFPRLASLGLSAPLGEHCADGGQVARLQLSALQELRLNDVLVKGGLRSMASRLTQLTGLHVCSTGGSGGPAWEVQCLTALSGLQALSLPALDQDARQALGLLAGLTALRFGAAGAGAVGANLRPLTSLRRLRVELHHKREHFLVLHPRVEWAALTQLQGVTALEVLSWAAGRHNAAPALNTPEFIWADQSAAEQHAHVLLAGLPELRRLRITAAFCRLELPLGLGRVGPAGGSTSAAGAAAAGSAGAEAAHSLAAQQQQQQQLLQLHARQELAAHWDGEDEHSRREVVGDTRGRWWLRSERRVPVERAGSRRGEGWYSAWWQPDVQAALTSTFGENDPSILRYRADTANVQGWINIRPALPQTFDLELLYRLAPVQQAG